MSSTSDQTTQQSKTRLIVGEIGVDNETGIIGKGHSYDNGKTFVVDDTIYGRIYHKDDHGRIWKGIQDKVEKVVKPAKSAADSAVSAADAAVASAQVTSDAVSAIASATAEAKQGANDAMIRAKSAWDVATGAKEAVTDFGPLLKQAQSDAGKALTQIADTASALSDAKTVFTSDVAVAKNLASTAQTTANNAVESASSVANDLAAVASQAKANTNGITKVTSDVGSLQTTVADNSGNISKIQETAKQIQQAVSDNAGNITVAKQTADSAVTVASDARSNATVASQTASQASITAQNASGQAASAVLTAQGALTTASNAKSDATVAIQTASGASLTATNAKNDATVAKQTASEAKVQASNAESDYAQLSIRANKIEANVATNSGAIASVQQTASGLTSRVGNLESKTNTQETAIEQNKKAIALKADQTAVNKINGTVNQLQSSLTVQAGQIQTKVSASDVSGMLKGYATQDYTQSLVTQKADEWNVNLTKLKNDTQTSLTSLAVGVEGVQAQVYNSDGSSKIAQLSNLIQSKVSQGDYNSQITQLKNDINLRVSKGDVISQINQEADGNTLIQVSNGKKSLILDADNTIITGKAWIPDAALSSISADKIMLGSSALWNTDGTLNLVNQNGNLKALIQVKQGLVQDTTQSIISFSSDYNNRAFSVTPVGATITPTLFFERYDQTEGHWLGFTRNEVRRDGLMFHTWDDEGERFFVGCHARFDRNISVDGTINQGTWNGTSGKPEAGILTIKSGNTIWSGSDFLAIGDHISNSFTKVMARSFSQQSTLSSKTNIETVDPKYALDLVNRTDIRSYQYKTDVAEGKAKRYTSLIIDDVNDVSQYCAPDEFVNEERTGRDDGSAVGYLFLAVKELTRRIKTLEEKLNG